MNKRVAVTTLDDLQVKITVVTKGLDQALGRVKNQLNEVLKEATKMTTGISDRLASLGEAIKHTVTENAAVELGKAAVQLVGQIESSVKDVKSVIMPAKEAISDISSLCGNEGIGALGTALQIVAEDRFPKLTQQLQNTWKLLSGNPVLVAVAAIAALIAILVTAYNTSDVFRAAVDNLVATISTALAPALEIVQGVLQVVWDEVLLPFGNFLLWLWETVLVPLAEVLTDVLGVAFSLVADLVSSLWNNVLAPFGGFLVTVLGGALQGVVAILTVWWQNLLLPIASFLSAVFRPAVEGISAVFTFLWQNVLLPLIEFMAGQFSTQFNNLTAMIGGIIEGLKTTFAGLIDFIVGVFTGDWKTAWNGVKDIFKGVFDALWSIVKYPLNLIIGGINLLIGGLNKISFHVPDWVPLLGGRSWGINIPKIQKLALGGIVDGPTLALIGERGREAVVPLENTGFVSAIANAVASAVGTAMLQVQKMGGSRDIQQGRELALYMDTKLVARVLIPALDSERNRTGMTPVIKTT